MVGKAKGEPSRVGYIVWNGLGGDEGCGEGSGGYDETRRGDDHVRYRMRDDMED